MNKIASAINAAPKTIAIGRPARLPIVHDRFGFASSAELIISPRQTNRNDLPGNIVPAIVAMLAMDLKEATATNVWRARYARKLTQEELAEASD